ncbi:hypothetical protein GCM10022291_13350 [Postechiella marina]|uniref:DUF4302 domain-containing protein n=1 Tax=Postechiella marina TaxID=943941 RepID=A0ABP8C6T4_9FLAO
MKNIYKLLTSLSVFMLLLVITSCNSDNEVEPLFDQSINERTDALKSEYSNILTAPENGWVGYYSPNESFGFYTVLFDFDENGSVALKSDYDSGSADNSVTYRIDKSLKIELVFESSSVFSQIFSLNNNDNGGEFVFNILSATDNEVVLESKLDYGSDITVFTLRRARADELDLAPVYASVNNISGDGTESVFRNILFNDEAIGSFSFNPTTRYATVTYLTDGEFEIVSVPIIITATGFSFVDPLDINGVILTSFEYNDTENQFENPADALKIVYDDIPGLPLTPYDFGNEAGNIRILRTNDGFLSVDRSSSNFINLFEGWRSDFEASIGLPITRFYIRDIGSDVAYLDIWIPVTGGTARAYFDCTVDVTQDASGNNIVKFTFIEDSPGNQDFGLASFFAPMTDFIFRESGFYVQKMELLNAAGQNTLGLIPVDDPSMLVHWYDF